MEAVKTRYGPYEHYIMPNGTSVYYRDDLHTYHTSIRQDKKGEWIGQGRWGDLPSPSQIAKYADPNPDKLMDWAARKQVEGVYSLPLKVTDISTINAEKCLELLRKHNLTWRDLRDSKGKVGSIAHDAFYNLLGGDPVAAAGEEERGYVEGVQAFFETLGEFELLQRETVVYSREHGFAGRFDARIKVPLPQVGTVDRAHETWLLDGKTSGYIGRAYHNQLAGYDLAAEESGYGASDRIFILQWLPEPDDQGRRFYLWPCRGTREGFLLNLASYKDGKRMDIETKQDWKALTA